MKALYILAKAPSTEADGIGDYSFHCLPYDLSLTSKGFVWDGILVLMMINGSRDRVAQISSVIFILH